jgi:signal transduction histidine kinase
VLRLLARIQERPMIVAVVGIALEVGIMTIAGSDDAIGGVRGVGGETALSLAVLGALFGGPVVGVLMVAAGWAVFFPTIADSRLSSVIALPEWTLTVLLVGLLSRAMVAVERRRVEAERDREAAHALRAPVATIRGLVDFLRRRGGPRSPEEEKVVLALGDETDRLLSSPLLERPSDRREAAESGQESPT